MRSLLLALPVLCLACDQKGEADEDTAADASETSTDTETGAEGSDSDAEDPADEDEGGDTEVSEETEDEAEETGGDEEDAEEEVEEESIDWSLEVLTELGRLSYQVSAARVFDTDGDGTVDASDDMYIASTGVGPGAQKFVELFSVDSAGVSSVPTRVMKGSRRATSRFGDVDGLPGAELVAAAYWSDSDIGKISIVGENGRDLLPIPEDSAYLSWLGDLDGDLSADIGLLDRVIDPTDRSRVARWQATGQDAEPLWIDLDLDGVPELLGTQTRGSTTSVGLLDSAGAISSACTSYTGKWSTFYFAVGNLDSDLEGEFVVAFDGEVAICDADGSLLARRSSAIGQPAMVGIAELDGDSAPEILISGASSSGGSYQLDVYDRALSPRWSRDGGSFWSPFTVADLDCDGAHEVVTLTSDGVTILDGAGAELSSWPMPSGVTITSWQGQPIVADVDNDDLAEIVVPLSESVILETADGGFDAPGASQGWSGLHHFPGLMAEDGTLALTLAHWLIPGHNAWQGHPACLPSTR